MKRFFPRLACVLALILLPVAGNRFFHSHGPSPFRNHSGRPLRCAIHPGDSMQLATSLAVGLNYEFLRAFVKDHSDSAAIFLADEKVSYLDSLLLDSLDILVLPASGYRDTAGLTALPLEESPVVWVYKSGHRGNRELVRWFARYKGTAEHDATVNRFSKCYGAPDNAWRADSGIISPYDEALKTSAKTLGWDWKLLAALAWSESKFLIQAESPRGALGIMQMMPVTAKRFGVNDPLDPEQNIQAGTRYLAFLKKMLSMYSEDPEILKWMTIGAYNSGGGRALQDLESGETGPATGAYIKAITRQYRIFQGIKEPETILLSPDSLSRVNPRDEHARDQEQKHDDHEGDDIGENDHGDIDVDGDKGDEVILGIEP